VNTRDLDSGYTGSRIWILQLDCFDPGSLDPRWFSFIVFIRFLSRLNAAVINLDALYNLSRIINAINNIITK